MKRRDFLSASGLLGLGLTTSAVAGRPEAMQADDQQLLEWIAYKLHVGSREDLVGAFYRDIAIPALNRIGIGPVGVFTVRYGTNDPTLYALLPHDNMVSVLTKTSALLDDADFMQDGEAFLQAPLSSPMYVRFESSLMRAFPNLPRVEPPPFQENDSRIYELRIYESHSIVQAAKKVHMFNEGGEIDIFHATGLTPVFFGETIIGPRMPNLTYMLAFESMAVRDENWDRFRSHPDWQSLRQEPYYADTVSAITDFILTPEPYSQV